jgi:thiamine biosynthesis protein ThiS
VVYLDDKPLRPPAGVTLLELLKLAGRSPALTAVTVNGEFVPRSDYKKLALPEGARVRAHELHDGG